jgi:transposase
MDRDDLQEIFLRWRAGHSISGIAKALGIDRKTIRQYLERFAEGGLDQIGENPDKEALGELFDRILPTTERAKPAQAELDPYTEEIKQLIQDKQEPVKPKTAYEILKRKYAIRASYESFKLFVRSRDLAVKPQKQTYRIELPPGRESQIDYGKVGLHDDPECDRNRVVWGFCTILSHSRFPFIQYVYTQKQVSFVGSLIDAFEFYQGTTEFVSLDNLKSGVITPDLWDPKLNKSLAEAAEYYGVFIDPCRVGKPTDKGKIERTIPMARELFRMLKKVYPSADLNELNRHALIWCREEYGRREHGTTHVPPLEAFQSTEKATLKPLPAERFEVPVWKKVSVHQGDGFFSFLNKRYAVPPAYRKCREVWLRYTERTRLLQVFFEYRLIREYVVTSKGVNFLPGDFPEVISMMMDGSYPQYLLRSSRAFGPSAYSLVESVLKPHAYLNARRAKGIIEVMKEYHGKPFFVQVCREAMQRGVKLPKTFRAMLVAEEQQQELDLQLPISEMGQKMLRDISYYLN